VQSAVFGLGIEPAIDLVAGTAVAGRQRDRPSTDQCRTNVPGIFAAGDVAKPLSPRVRTPDARRALAERREAGRRAARAMLGRGQSYDEGVHWFWSDQFDAKQSSTRDFTPPGRIVVRGSLASRKVSSRSI